MSVEVDESLPSLTLEILDILRFIEDKIIPLLSFERERVLDSKLIRCDYYVIPIRLSKE